MANPKEMKLGEIVEELLEIEIGFHLKKTHGSGPSLKGKTKRFEDLIKDVNENWKRKD